MRVSYFFVQDHNMSYQPPDERECASGTEMAGKAEGCKGCPNSQACASAPKGPDPGM